MNTKTIKIIAAVTAFLILPISQKLRALVRYASGALHPREIGLGEKKDKVGKCSETSLERFFRNRPRAGNGKNTRVHGFCLR